MKILISSVNILFYLVALASCSGESDSVVSSSSNSGNIATSQFYTVFEIYEDSEGTITADAQITRDSLPSEEKDDDEYIELTGGDSLWLSSGESIADLDLDDDLFASLQQAAETQELFEGTIISYRREYLFWSNLVPEQIFYHGSLEGKEASSKYTISLIRNEEQDALYSSATMPMPYQLISPASNELFSRSNDEIIISWDTIDNDVKINIEIETACLSDQGDSYSLTTDTDNGELILAAGELVSDEVIGGCSTTINVFKTRFGILSDKLNNGFISANQSRSVTITTID